MSVIIAAYDPSAPSGHLPFADSPKGRQLTTARYRIRAGARPILSPRLLY